jgi:hypothetical protein
MATASVMTVVAHDLPNQLLIQGPAGSVTQGACRSDNRAPLVLH